MHLIRLMSKGQTAYCAWKEYADAKKVGTLTIVRDCS